MAERKTKNTRKSTLRKGSTLPHHLLRMKRDIGEKGIGESHLQVKVIGIKRDTDTLRRVRLIDVDRRDVTQVRVIVGDTQDVLHLKIGAAIEGGLTLVLTCSSMETESDSKRRQINFAKELKTSKSK